ncbi:hypothetical protein COCOBI_03-5200 [Coccomyxa sp. Obi]|nr:hypothetical protein COCOBI_03-5200 [Coccomyxa sp. Obi]
MSGVLARVRALLGRTGKRVAAPGEGPVMEVMQWGNLLLYATQRGGIHAWDLRADTNAWTLPCTSNQARLPPLRESTLLCLVETGIDQPSDDCLLKVLKCHEAFGLDCQASLAPT